jgi:hypothetical protein
VGVNMSLLRLQPDQVIKLWSHIKWAGYHAEMVPVEHAGEYCRKLLLDILSEKTQIWVIMDEDRIKTIFATSIQTDNLTHLRELYINFVYGYSPLTDEDIISSFEELKTVARNYNCKSVRAFTINKRVQQICERAGATQPYLVYKFDL